MAYQLPLEITREEDFWMARTLAIQGFLATGETLEWPACGAAGCAGTL